MTTTNENQNLRVAIFGGKGKTPSYYGFEKARIYRSPRDGSKLDTARLIKSIKRGTIDLVVILTRFNAHTETKMVRRACQKYDVPYEIRNK